MKPGGDFDQRADPPAHRACAAVRTQDPGQQLERRGLARAVRADDPERLAATAPRRRRPSPPRIPDLELGRARVCAKARRARCGMRSRRLSCRSPLRNFFQTLVECDDRARHSDVLREPEFGAVKRQPARRQRHRHENGGSEQKRRIERRAAVEEDGTVGVDDRRHRIQQREYGRCGRRESAPDRAPTSRTSTP